MEAMMEYYLCRAMEVGRLSPVQLDRLHNQEQKKCLFPFEIQSLFNLSTLKQIWGIPNNDISQDLHNQRLRLDFKKINLVPAMGDLSVLDTSAVHDFDIRVRHEMEQGNLNLSCNIGGGKKRLKDSVDEE